MEYKPSDVFVGVIDFFAVLLPGAFLALIGIEPARKYLFNDGILPGPQTEAQGWVAFIFAAYLLGHFAFLIGSHLDSIYDKTYRKRKTRQGHKLLDRVQEIKAGQLGDEHEKITNAFQWTRANVQLQSPLAAAEINRLEADSKFFRSMIVALFVFCIALAVKGAWFQFAVGLVLMALSFWRYSEQRWKFTTLTYRYFLALELVQKPKPETGTKAAGA
ncbi:MAG: hypothetical protein ACJ74J_22235 [Blastocatellia bacterium]